MISASDPVTAGNKIESDYNLVDSLTGLYLEDFGVYAFDHTGGKFRLKLTNHQEFAFRFPDYLTAEQGIRCITGLYEKFRFSPIVAESRG